MNPRSVSQSIENLRKSRLRKEFDPSIARVVGAVRDETRRNAKGLGNAGGVWAALCPANLVARTRVESLSRNVLTVCVEDSAAKFVLDRWLRDGGQDEFIRACSVPVKRVKLVTGSAA